jgi:hypothetical protein
MSRVSWGNAAGNMVSDRMVNITWRGSSSAEIWPRACRCRMRSRPRAVAARRFFSSINLRPAFCNASHSSRRTQSVSLHAASNQKDRLSAGSPDSVSAHACRSDHFQAQHLAEQAFLVAEIMVEHPFVDGRALGNGVHPRAGKTVQGELLQRGGQNPLARAPGVARRKT